MQYIKILKWDEFQHYKNRDPLWIKLYRSILDQYEYDCLQDDSKLLLFTLWLLAARLSNKIPFDLDWIRKQGCLNNELSMQALDALINTGFIETVDEEYEPAISLLSTRYQGAIPKQDQEQYKQEKEKEQDKEEKPKIVDWNNSSFSLKLGLDLDEKISKGFKPFTEKEVVTFERIRQHLVRWANKHNTESRVHTIEGMIEASHKAGVKSPKAMFVSLVKKHAGYTGTGVIL